MKTVADLIMNSGHFQIDTPCDKPSISATENGTSILQMYLDYTSPLDNSRCGDIIQLLEAGTRRQTSGVNIAARGFARYIKSFGC